MKLALAFMKSASILVVVMGLVAGAGCGRKRARTPATAQPSTTNTDVAGQRVEPLPPPRSSSTREPADLAPLDRSDDIRSMTLDALNASSPLADIRFDYDSAILSPEAREVLSAHARWLTSHRSVTVIIEGHCDERGTVEYNLALGDRRSLAAHTYLVSLGVDGARMKTISYGKEFPLDPGHYDASWARNRRARFLITGK